MTVSPEVVEQPRHLGKHSSSNSSTEQTYLQQSACITTTPKPGPQSRALCGTVCTLSIANIMLLN